MNPARLRIQSPLPQMTPPNSDAPSSKPIPRFASFVASGFGLGYLPMAPGTWGSMLGVLVFVALFLDYLPFVPHAGKWPYEPLPATIVIALVGAWAAHSVARALGQHDPQFVVVDEVSGQQIALLPICFFHWHPQVLRKIDLRLPEWQYLLAGFVLFRIFDIWKPWPARAAEKLPGGWGIMADDWVAGIYAAICLWGLRALGL